MSDTVDVPLVQLPMRVDIPASVEDLTMALAEERVMHAETLAQREWARDWAVRLEGELANKEAINEQLKAALDKSNRALNVLKYGSE